MCKCGRDYALNTESGGKGRTAKLLARVLLVAILVVTMVPIVAIADDGVGKFDTPDSYVKIVDGTYYPITVEDLGEFLYPEDILALNSGAVEVDQITEIVFGFEEFCTVESIGDGFLAYMFRDKGDNLTRLDLGGFVWLESVGNDFCKFTFETTSRTYSPQTVFTIPADFTFPQGITAAGNDFAFGMFYARWALTSVPDGFNLPQGLYSTGNNFCHAMFAGTQVSSLPDDFNMPQMLESVGSGFAQEMFDSCPLEKLPDGFNLPQNLYSVGDSFACEMFATCYSLTGLPEGFNLPQNLISAGYNFANRMFSASAFTQTGRTITVTNNTNQLIYGFTNLGNLDAHSSVQISCTTELVGLPGSGDFDGDGIVTVADALSVAMYVVSGGAISSGKLTSADIDGDGMLTMSDVTKIVRIAIGL